MHDPLLYAKQFVEAGMFLVPLSGRKPTRSWLATPEETQNVLRQLKKKEITNYGVCPGKNFLIIDIDPRNFVEGIDSIEVLTETVFGGDLTPVDDTFGVQTGRGGVHAYFKLPPGAEGADLRTKLRAMPGIDFIRGTGSYVVGPGSIHPMNKQPYEPQREVVGKLSVLPMVAVEALTRRNFVTAGGKDKETLDAPTDVARYIEALKTRDPAVAGQSGDNWTYQTACVGRDLGLSESETLRCMLEFWNDRCSPSWDSDELARKVSNAYQYATRSVGADSVDGAFSAVRKRTKYDIKWDLKADKSLKTTLGNTVNYFHMEDTGLRDILAYNLFANEIRFTSRAPWHDDTELLEGLQWIESDTTQCKYHLTQEFHYEPSGTLVEEAVVVASMRRKFDPLRESLEAMEKEWDGKPRIHNWLTEYCGAEDNVYTREVGLITLLGAVERAMIPGCKFDYVMVLEGLQGVRKTTVVEILGGEFFANFEIDPGNKDTLCDMRGCWIAEMGEMHALKQSELTILDNFITRKTDRYRPPYSEVSRGFPRRCIFIGTVNPTGAGWLRGMEHRRYWPIAVVWCDTDRLRADIRQMWGEAVALWRKRTHKLFLSPVAVAAHKEMTEDRKVEDPWTSTVTEYVKDRDTVIMADIWTKGMFRVVDQMTPADQHRIANILVYGLKWEPYRMFLPGRPRGYHRPGFKNEPHLRPKVPRAK